MSKEDNFDINRAFIEAKAKARVYAVECWDSQNESFVISFTAFDEDDLRHRMYDAVINKQFYKAEPGGSYDAGIYVRLDTVVAFKILDSKSTP